MANTQLFPNTHIYTYTYAYGMIITTYLEAQLEAQKTFKVKKLSA